MIILLTLILKALANEKILEYKFGETIGIYVKDSSGQGKHGTVSGDGAQWTSRGIYLGNKHLQIIPTDSSLSIPATIFMWILPVDFQGTIFSLKGKAKNRMIISFNKNHFQMTKIDSNIEGTNKHKTSLNDKKWILIRVYLVNKDYFGGFEPFTESEIKYTDKNDINIIDWAKIGHYNKDFTALKSFIWYFVIIKDDIPYETFYSELNGCSSPPSCSQCTYFILDPVHGNMCLSNSTNPSDNPEYSFCNSTQCFALNFAGNCTCPTFCIYDLKDQTTTCDAPIISCQSPYIQLGIDCCDSVCKSCHDTTSCVTCLDPYARPANTLEINNYLCVCEDGYWGTAKTPGLATECKKCPALCLTCNTDTDCTKCLDSNTNLKNGICSCESGFYFNNDEVNPKCLACGFGCKLCDQSVCIECFYNLSIIDGKICVCGDGFFLSKAESSYSCIACSKGCLNCTSLSKCLLCSDQNSNIVNGKCMCNQFYIGSATPANPCIPVCGRACLICYNSTFCKVCSDTNAIISNGKCICKTGYYLNSIDKKSCLICGKGCLRCDEKGICEECFDTNAYLNNKDCECNPGYYGEYFIDSNNLTCLKCDSDCLECSSVNFCTSCFDENANPNNGICVCKEKHFMDSFSLICKPCHSDCNSCKNQSQCSTCISQNSVPNTETGCICNPGYYNTSSLNSSNSCKPCRNRCETCLDKDLCLNCKGSNTSLIEGICNCKAGHYFKSDSSIDCEPCITFKEAKSCRKDCGKGKAWFNLNCVNCSDYCLDCDDSLVCIECQEGMKVDNGKCVCLKAQKLENDECAYQYFNLILAIGQNNSIHLEFDEDLENDLELDGLKLYVAGNLKEIVLDKKGSREYEISLKSTEFYIVSTAFSLKISSPLYSSNNSVLKNYEYYGDFLPSPTTPFAKAIKSTMKGVMSTTFASSMVSNPASCWVLINTIQIIIYLPLSPLKYPSKILEFLQALAGYSIVPNLMEFLFDSEASSHPTQRIERVGLSTTVFWINIGQNFVMLLFNLILWPFLFFGSKLPYVSNFCLNLLLNYRYNLFIRFWVEVYLELGLFSMIQIQSVRFI